MEVNRKVLQKYINAFIIYEIAADGVDPRETLEGTVMRNNKYEGYKYHEYEKGRKRLSKGNSYTEALIDSLPGYNLVDRFQKDNVLNILEQSGTDIFEQTLKDLYEKDNDEQAFAEMVSIIGGQFDVLGFTFFLKDASKYLPIRSRNFDKRFKLLGIDSNLAGNCNWNKYKEYNDLIFEIKEILAKNINKNITLLDAHSFIWILPKLDEYLDNNYQIVEHKKFGKGVVVNVDEKYITIKFPDGEKVFDKDIISNNQILSFVPPTFDLGNKENKQEESLISQDPTNIEQKGVESNKNIDKNINREEMFGTFDSWTVEDIYTAIKQCDKSFFDYRGSGIPRQICWFFNVDKLNAGERREISLQYKGNVYDAHLHRGTDELERVRIFWQQKLADEFKEYELLDSNPKLEFNKKSDTFYKVDFRTDKEKSKEFEEAVSTKILSEEENCLPEEIKEESSSQIIEGAKKTIIVNSYERDPKAKKICKEYYMKKYGHITCQVCGFDFGKVYGTEYANRIHMHHIKPISEIGEEYVLDPVKDLIPVCPNCHMVLHDGKGISVEELKKKVNHKDNRQEGK